MKQVSFYSVLVAVECEQEFNELTKNGVAFVEFGKLPLFTAHCDNMGVMIGGGAIECGGQYIYKL